MRPTIQSVLETELYANQRLLITAHAKADQARLLAAQHDAALSAQKSVVSRLQAQATSVTCEVTV